MNVGKNWHPIFGFIAERLNGDNSKFLFNERYNLRIEIERKHGSQEVVIGVARVRSKDQTLERLRGLGELADYQEGVRLNYSDGTCVFLKGARINTILLGPDKTYCTKEEDGPYSSESFINEDVSNARRGLNNLIRLIKESEGEYSPGPTEEMTVEYIC